MVNVTAEETSPAAIVRGVLQPIFGPLHPHGAFSPAGMAFSELVVLYELVAREKCDRALEIGMANAGSSVVICAAMTSRVGTLLSIDPFQTADYRGKGVANLEIAGFNRQHQLIEEPSHLALPVLLREERRFDFIFIDGWHAFDYVMVDMFYSDLLLKDGGVLAFHDTDAAAVHKAVMFLERHRPYRRLSPPPAKALPSLTARVARRLTTAVSGPQRRQEIRERRSRWRTLSAYRKLRSELTAESIAAF